MALTINTNVAATSASINLQTNNEQLQKSLKRLASGNKITSPSDDAGGLAVSMKITAAIKRTHAVNINLSNAISFLQTQDGAMYTADKILERIAELKMLSTDVTKGPLDIANYNCEFNELQAELSSLVNSTFNSVSLFQSPATSATVITTEDGTQSLNLTIPDMYAAYATLITAAVTSLSSISVSAITTAIQNLATNRATNGAQSSRLMFASEMLDINSSNLESANSRITDTDVADESTRFARYNILVQSGAAMLAQANTTPQIALKLLG